MQSVIFPASLLALALSFVCQPVSGADNQVSTDAGALEGVSLEGGLHAFKGIPYAAPPVGDLRWQAPQPAPHWEGVRQAEKFGPRAMQRPLYGDMNFRSAGMSEDCLYLNVWTPARSSDEKLPVLVYLYGGGFLAGDASEGRYDGESMARKGIVYVSVNYRLDVLGFFAHPALTQESPHHASGNYGLLDQQAALAWVGRNIAAFGGDPQRVTLAGESAGSISVSAQMVSPLSKGLIAGAIGESGSLLGTLPPVPLAEAEARGVKFAATLGQGDAPSLAELRAMSAERLLEAVAKPGQPRFSLTVDGWFLPKPPLELYREGAQAHVPLLAGVNSAEASHTAVLNREPPTVENYCQALQRLYPDHVEEVIKVYPAANEAEVLDAAQDLASDRFISYGTWKWMDLATKTGGQPTFYYLYAHPRPAMRPEMGDAVPGLAGGVIHDPKAKKEQPPARGAVHSAEIEYALGNLRLNQVYAWTPQDEQLSATMQELFACFIKNGDPNGPGLPEWPKFASGQRLVIDLKPRVESTDALRRRYEVLETLPFPVRK